ncbi:TetR/AcrR family transcriptional regulator [Leucobacter sp. USHLN154]|uniref:TetR/AcrR family transcriptional regulator n=1 Tax=Leucobacter sp. USHLN154 TaxID=3081269 RepID=UPI00301A55F3
MPPHGAGMTPESSTAAIRHLAERGYEATTAEALAAAVGMSRSTFFRRFGSKDDVIFADHDHALARLEAALEDTTLTPADALVSATADVLRLLLRDPEAARLRFELMRLTPALRDRELVITHRYERVFTRYIREVQQPGAPAWVASTLGASLVAAHNAALRAWLRGRTTDAAAALTEDLRELTSLYLRWFTADHDSSERRVLVAVYDATGSPDSVLTAVSEQLRR